MILGMHHTGITTPDLERLSSFYCEQLGFERVFEFTVRDSPDADAIWGLRGAAARMAILRSRRGFIEMFEFLSPPAEAAPGRPRINAVGLSHLCVQVEDIDAEYARLAAAGVPFQCEPKSFPGLCRATYGRDPDGNIIELVEPDPAGPLMPR
jgi:glyoxylase I family protein